MTIGEIIALIIALVGACSGLYAAWLNYKQSKNRLKSQNTLDDASASEIFERIATSRQKENDLLRIQITDLTERIDKMEQSISGPFRVTLEFTTSPELKITKAEISLVPKDVVTK